MSNFVNTLNDLMLENGLKVADIARETGINQRTLSNLKYFSPTVFSAIKIADYFETSLDFFEKKSDIFKCSFNKKFTFCFKDNFLKLLKQYNVSRYEFSKKLNISESTVSRWINKNAIPNYENIVDTANFFDCSIDELIGRK